MLLNLIIHRFFTHSFLGTNFSQTFKPPIHIFRAVSQMIPATRRCRMMALKVRQYCRHTNRDQSSCWNVPLNINPWFPSRFRYFSLYFFLAYTFTASSEGVTMGEECSPVLIPGTDSCLKYDDIPSSSSALDYDPYFDRPHTQWRYGERICLIYWVSPRGVCRDAKQYTDLW